MASHQRPQLLEAARTHIDGAHSAQPVWQLIMGQAERLSMVCVRACVVHTCWGEGIAWVGLSQRILQGHPLPTADLVPTPGWDRGACPSLTSPADLSWHGGGRRLERIYFLGVRGSERPEKGLDGLEGEAESGSVSVSPFLGLLCFSGRS